MADRFRRRIDTDRDRAICARAVERAPVGYVCEIRSETRSTQQNARLWAQLTDVSEQVDWYGQKLTPENWKHVFSASLKKQEAVPGIDGGFVVLGQSTSKMTVAEMGDLMTLIDAFGAERGVIFGDEAKPDNG